MLHKRIIYIVAVIVGTSISPAAYAWFFFIPIPNLAKPAPLDRLIEVLEKSEETKALAYVSEDKTFGSKFWAWGHFSGHVTQAEANRIALSRCQAALANAKSQKAGGKELYDFGTKVCELHNFENKTVSPLATEQQRATPSVPSAIKPAPIEQQPQAAPVAPTPEQTMLPAASPASALPTPAEIQSTPAQSTESHALPPPAAMPLAPVSASQTQNQATKPQKTESPTARRLRELNELREEGLITEHEYNEKRKAILSTM